VTRPLKIDLHTHILPASWPNLQDRYGYGGFMQLDHYADGCARMIVDGEAFRDVRANCWDPAVRLEECDRGGVDVQVLSTVPIMFNYWAKPADALDLSRFLNDHLKSVVDQYPARFMALGSLPMQAPDLAMRELERCVRELGIPGVQIGTHVNGKNLDDPGVVAVLECAADLDTAVFVHPWDMLARDRMRNYWLSWLVGMPAETALAICSLIFGGVLDRLPRLRICFAHGGGAFPGTLGRIEHGYQVRPDLCAVSGGSSPRELVGRLYLDSLVHDPRMFAVLLEQVGAHRIALGSDYPFPLGEEQPGCLVESLGLPDDQRERILSGTALEFLKRDAAQFANG